MRALLATLCVTLLLTGCMGDGQLPLAGSASRYDIDAYEEKSSLNGDLTGLWITLHNGTLKEKVDGVNYTITGNIREIVQITRTNNVYYLRTCLEPETKHVMSVSGSSVSGMVNDEQVELTAASNTAMSGTASHSATDSSYSGTVEMKKVAALGESFGLFSYLDSGNQADVATASCFQEASLHVVGSISLFSKWADLELGNFTDWSGSTLYQSSYLFSRAGTADPVRQARFAEGVSSLTAREFPVDDEIITVAVDSTSEASYHSTFAVGSLIAGSVTLDFDFAAVAHSAAAPAGSAGSFESLPEGTPTTSSGSPDFYSMMMWMAGLFQISLPW